MKKIIKSSAILIGVCFFAGAANAQLASDMPSMTAQQMTDLMQKRKADAKIVPAPVTTVSNKTVSTNAPSNLIVKIEPAKTVQPVTTASSIPAISDQGGVKPVAIEPATQSKAQQPPVQSEKPVATKQQ